jgi:hypothetical protein
MSPYGLAGPRGLPVPIVTVLHDAFRKALVAPQVGQELAKYDQEIDYLGPEDYGRACREQYARERVIAERLGLCAGRLEGPVAERVPSGAVEASRVLAPAQTCGWPRRPRSAATSSPALSSTGRPAEVLHRSTTCSIGATTPRHRRCGGLDADGNFQAGPSLPMATAIGRPRLDLLPRRTAQLRARHEVHVRRLSRADTHRPRAPGAGTATPAGRRRRGVSLAMLGCAAA